MGKHFYGDGIFSRGYLDYRDFLWIFKWFRRLISSTKLSAEVTAPQNKSRPPHLLSLNYKAGHSKRKPNPPLPPRLKNAKIFAILTDTKRFWTKKVKTPQAKTISFVTPPMTSQNPAKRVKGGGIGACKRNFLNSHHLGIKDIKNTDENPCKINWNQFQKSSN